MELYTKDGHRKYLTSEERALFKQACFNSNREHRSFALMLYHTGCRISEALNLKRSS
ncbi:MAG: integrase/recombinase XerD, partial [Saprospiraceae bacterium]